MKILHFCYDHPDNPWVGGGGAGRTWHVNKYLSRKHDITVLCGGFPGAVQKGEPFHVSFLGSAKKYVESRLKYVWNSRRVDTSCYDLVVEEFSYYAPIFSRFRGKPAVTIIQSNHGLSALGFHQVYGVVSLISQYLVLPYRKNVIIVSEHLRPAVNKAVCTATIGQGAEIPEELPPASEDYVLFLGRLDFKIKGLDMLIKAWASIPSDKRKIPLVIAGGGDDAKVKDYIRQVGAENIVLIGSLNHFEALSYIRKAAFVCVPSRMEGSPLVVYESLALGKPIIGTSIPSIRALLNHNENGILVSPEDSEALAQAILVLFDDTKRKTLMKGAKKAGEKFSWKNIAEKQETFYSCVREKSGKG